VIKSAWHDATPHGQIAEDVNANFGTINPFHEYIRADKARADIEALQAELEAEREMVADLRKMVAEKAAVHGLTPDILERAVALGVEAGRADIQAAVQRAIEACEAKCYENWKAFSSPEYTTGQPMASFGERFAAESCAEDIRALLDPAALAKIIDGGEG
jgi:hypothetical protein